MPPLDDQIEDTNSSNVSDLDDQQQTPVDNTADVKPVEPADSSPATDGADNFDPLSVVRDVVDKRKEPEPVAASPAEGEEGSKDDEGEKKQDDENYSDVPFHKHPRFQQLLRRTKAAEVDAVRYRNVQSYLDERGLTAEEAADGLDIMGLMKTNPAEAWKRLKPVVEKVLLAAGEILPPDLDQRVQNGEFSREAAIEVARARAQANSVTATQQFQQQREEQRRLQEFGRSLISAADEWETQRRSRDPNFAAKEESLLKELTWIQHREGKPTTPEGVRAQLDKAYAAVNAGLRPAPAPQPRPVPRRPVVGGQVAGNQQPAERSTLDIIKARVGNRG